MLKRSKRPACGNVGQHFLDVKPCATSQRAHRDRSEDCLNKMISARAKPIYKLILSTSRFVGGTRTIAKPVVGYAASFVAARAVGLLALVISTPTTTIAHRETQRKTHTERETESARTQQADTIPRGDINGIRSATIHCVVVQSCNSSYPYPIEMESPMSRMFGTVRLSGCGGSPHVGGVIAW